MTTNFDKKSSSCKRPRRARQGAAAVEFALIAPLFIALILAAIVYGGWFWLSHSVQTLATESARAALGGLDAPEQQALAEDFVSRHGAREAGFEPALTHVAFTAEADALTVTVAYDASRHPLLLLAGPLPRPPSVIRRSAVVRIGGY